MLKQTRASNIPAIKGPIKRGARSCSALTEDIESTTWCILVFPRGLMQNHLTYAYACGRMEYVERPGARQQSDRALFHCIDLLLALRDMCIG